MELEFADYYEKRCKIATIDQGIDLIINALDEAGIVATSEQTGGFTMCAYVEFSPNQYIYANLTGAGIYNEEGFVKDLIQFDEEQNPKVIANAIADYVKKEWSK